MTAPSKSYPSIWAGHRTCTWHVISISTYVNEYAYVHECNSARVCIFLYCFALLSNVHWQWHEKNQNVPNIMYWKKRQYTKIEVIQSCVSLLVFMPNQNNTCKWRWCFIASLHQLLCPWLESILNLCTMSYLRSGKNTRTCAYTYTTIFVYGNASMLIHASKKHTHTRAHTHIHTHTLSLALSLTNTQTHARIHTRTHMHTHTCTHARTYKQTRIHTHSHTRMYPCAH